MSFIAYIAKLVAQSISGKNYIKVRPSLVCHLLRNRLFVSCPKSFIVKLDRDLWTLFVSRRNIIGPEPFGTPCSLKSNI